MKAMRAEVDVLTLTATPIPRTLGMALEGLRDLSVIATAPQRRLAIKTFVRNEGNGVIREAVLRELKRGGQVYFLHNEVETIENRRQKLEEMLPEARIAVAHGQMPERELERVMRDFVAQRYNMLLCSTIIETGIDVPTANTIVMSRADKFGLAQLHQLRGRVGRSHHQAYAYLMVPDIEGLTKQAAQRLDAIQQMEELGSGFYLAMHDLEIRGAGEVLGENQSGNMMEIGFQLYNEMLTEAVRSLKAGKEPDLLAPLSVTTEINLHAPALLPDDYCGDVHLRLSFYKKLATAKTADQIDALLEEIVDRFGKLPPQAQTLIDVHRLRVLARPYGVVKVDAAPGVINITFKTDPPVDPMRIIQLIQKNKHIKLAGNEKLRIERELKEPKDRAQMVRDVLRHWGSRRSRSPRRAPDGPCRDGLEPVINSRATQSGRNHLAGGLPGGAGSPRTRPHKRPSWRSRRALSPPPHGRCVEVTEQATSEIKLPRCTPRISPPENSAWEKATPRSRAWSWSRCASASSPVHCRAASAWSRGACPKSWACRACPCARPCGSSRPRAW